MSTWQSHYTLNDYWFKKARLAGDLSLNDEQSKAKTIV